MKRFLCVWLSFLLVFSAFAVTASAAAPLASGTCGNQLTWTLTDSNALIISGTGAMKNYNGGDVPSWDSYKEQITSVSVGNGVTTIGDRAFNGFISITYISLPDSITSIGTQSFMDCSSLTGIRLSNNLISVGKWAFYDCTSLSSVTIPNKVTEIGALAFYGCSELSNVTLGGSVKTIGADAFLECTALNSINIPNSVTSIGEYAFSKTGLSSIVIPDSVTKLERCAFRYCEGLTSVTLSNNLTTISRYLFGNCKGLKTITLPEKITTIEDAAFVGCTGLKSINIPANVSKIEYSAFSGCESLTSISIPNKVTTIDTATFDGCKKLKSVTFWNSVTNIGISAFWNCPLSDVYFYGTSSDWNDIVIKSANDPLLNANIHYLQYYTLTYNANGGSGAPAAQTGSGTITLSRTQPTRTGYTFKGWATSAGATAAQYQPGASFSLTKNTTLYAVWQQIPETPQNPLANAKVYAGSPATVEYRANVTVTFTATGVPEGYHLVVVKEANGNTTVIAAGDHRSASAELGEVTESCEVYAWIIKDGASAGAAERDENGKVIGAMTSVNVNTGFLVRLIAFFKGLFGLLPKVEIKP